MTTAQTDLTFSSLTPSGDGWCRIVEINGTEWQTLFWDDCSLRQLQRTVPSGQATIRENQGGSFYLKIELAGLVRANIERSENFDNLHSAVAAAESFTWETKEHAGITWYATHQQQWAAYLGEGDKAEIGRYSSGREGTYYMKREISPRNGESYEMRAVRYDYGDDKHAVKTFEEAAAIVVTLPSFLAVLGSK